MNKPTVGQKLFARMYDGKNKPRREEWVTVSKVGRKYFSAVMPSGWEEAFHISSGTRAGEGYIHANVPITCYESEQHAKDEDTRSEYAEVLSLKMRHRADWNRLSLTELETINTIVFKS